MTLDPSKAPAAYGFTALPCRPSTTHGPLLGLTFAAKDVFDVAGQTTGAGNPDWARTHPPAEQSASVIVRLMEAGATLVGRTTSDELAFSLDGENIHFGTPINPRAPGRIPGGSSSGAAASVAAGLIDIGLGTDTSGSIRIPGSYCGLFGLRPTHGIVPTDGVFPLAPSFDTVGWLARDGATLLRTGEVLLPDRPKADVARLLIGMDAFAIADPRVADVLANAARMAAGTLARCDDVVISAEGLEQWANVYRIVQGAEVWATHGAWFERTSPNMSPDIRDRMIFSGTLRGEQCDEARRSARIIRERVRGLIGDAAVLCLPTAPSIAPLKAGGGMAVRMRILSLTCIAGFAGLPQVTVPVGEVDGCPVGLSFIGPAGSDRDLLSFISTLW